LARNQTDKSFLVLFFKKEHIFFFHFACNRKINVAISLSQV